MATLTAQILVPTAHRYHGGINPTHALYLSENDRPAWILIDAGVIDVADRQPKRIVWIPSVDHMVDDGLALIAAYVLGRKVWWARWVTRREARANPSNWSSRSPRKS